MDEEAPNYSNSVTVWNYQMYKCTSKYPYIHLKIEKKLTPFTKDMAWLISPLHLRIEVFVITVTNYAVVRNEVPRSTAEIYSCYRQHD